MHNNYLRLGSKSRSALAFALCSILSGASLALTPFLPPVQISDDQLNESINPDFLQISSDGRTVLFLSTQGNTQELFGVDTSTGNLTRLSGEIVAGGNVGVVDAVSRPRSPFQLTRDGLATRMTSSSCSKSPPAGALICV